MSFGIVITFRSGSIRSSDTDGQPEAYFRGRKLRGQELEVPKGYRGVIVKEAGKEKTDSQCTEKEALKREERDEGAEEQEVITVLNEVASFNNIIVWNHESIVDGDNAFMKGLSEWINFAKAVSLMSLYPNGQTRTTFTDMTSPTRCIPQKKGTSREAMMIELHIFARRVEWQTAHRSRFAVSEYARGTPDQLEGIIAGLFIRCRGRHALSWRHEASTI